MFADMMWYNAEQDMSTARSVKQVSSQVGGWVLFRGVRGDSIRFGCVSDRWWLCHFLDSSWKETNGGPERGSDRARERVRERKRERERV